MRYRWGTDVETEATSFPGSLFFPPPVATGDGKKRDPGNEVETEVVDGSF